MLDRGWALHRLGAVEVSASGSRHPAGGLDSLVRAALAEDIGEGDRTTEWTIPENSWSRAEVVAKESLVKRNRTRTVWPA